MKKYYIAIAIIIIVSLLAIGLNISVSKGPAGDNARVNDIESLDTAVQSYATKNQVLPSSLTAVDVSSDLKSRIGDYGYKPGIGGKFQLCATFKTDTTKTASALYGGSAAESTNAAIHTKGLVCTDFTSYGLSYNSTYSGLSYRTTPTPEPVASSMPKRVCATTLLPNEIVHYGTIMKVDTKAGTVTTPTGSYHWELPPATSLVYDIDCKVSSVAVLKVGTDVAIYHTAAGLIQTMQLQ